MFAVLFLTHFSGSPLVSGSIESESQSAMNGVNPRNDGQNGHRSKKVNAPRFVMKEKKIRQNVLDILDKEMFAVSEEATDRGDWKNYSVALKSSKDAMEVDPEPALIGHGREDEAKHDDVTRSLIRNEQESNGGGGGTVSVDAPHRDWSVLAKYLKDSSKEQAKRKQILKQLERILHVREGLIVGFEQLRQHHAQWTQHKIQ